MNDETILGLLLSREECAIEQLNGVYGAYCRSIANNLLGSPEDAEECVSDTWLRVWQSIPPQRPKRLKAYLARITRNLALNRIKAGSTRKRGGGEADALLEELAECLPGEESAEGAVLAQELGGRIDTFLRGLPRREADIFLRRYFYAEPRADIARRYGMRENQVSVLLSRTRQRLKKELEQEGYL